MSHFLTSFYYLLGVNTVACDGAEYHGGGDTVQQRCRGVYLMAARKCRDELGHHSMWHGLTSVFFTV